MELGVKLVGRMLEAVARLAPTNLDLSNVCCRVARGIGANQSMRAIARSSLAELSSNPELLADLLARKANRTRPDKPSEDHLLQALGDIQACLQVLHVRPFLLFGSLLGPIRDQRFIPGDDDLDLGVLGQEGFQLAEQAIIQSDSLKVIGTRRVGSTVTKLRLLHENGTLIDIKLFNRESCGGVSWYVHLGNYSLKKIYPHPFDLGKLTFKGLDCAIPAEPERFLDWQYGNWRKPDSSYSMLTSGPINSEAHFLFVDECAPFAMTRALYHGRSQRFADDVHNMVSLFPQDDLWQDLERNISTVMPLSKAG